MSFTQQTDLMARVRLAEHQQTVSAINANGWWRHEPQPSPSSPPWPRRWAGRLLIRAGGWLAGLAVDEALAGRRPAQTSWSSPAADLTTILG